MQLCEDHRLMSVTGISADECVGCAHEAIRKTLAAEHAKVVELLAAIQTATTGDCLSADRVTTYRACLLCRQDLDTCAKDYAVAIETGNDRLACRGAKARALVCATG